jgi:hypothetical protein
MATVANRTVALASDEDPSDYQNDPPLKLWKRFQYLTTPRQPSEPISLYPPPSVNRLSPSVFIGSSNPLIQFFKKLINFSKSQTVFRKISQLFNKVSPFGVSL